MRKLPALLPTFLYLAAVLAIRSTTTTTIEAGTSMDVDALAGGITIDATTSIDIDAVTISMGTTGLTTSVDIEATRIDLN
mgnify:CR=1 FL=1